MDITDRLRQLYVQQGTNYAQEAAAEIERLRKENTALRIERATWWALIMDAAASLETCALSIQSDPDARRSANSAAEYYRSRANSAWVKLNSGSGDGQ